MERYRDGNLAGGLQAAEWYGRHAHEFEWPRYGVVDASNTRILRAVVSPP